MKLSRPLLASVSSSCMGLIPHFLHHHCRERNNLFSPLLRCWLRTPIIKRQFNRQKTNKFNNMYTSCTHGRTQENLISSQKGPSYHLKYYLQLKTKKKKKKMSGWKPVTGGFQAQQVKKGTVGAQMSVSGFLTDKSFQTFSHPLFLTWTGRHPLNGDFPCKCTWLLRKGDFSFQSCFCVCSFLKILTLT